jgi:hypothetical protein
MGCLWKPRVGLGFWSELRTNMLNLNVLESRGIDCYPMVIKAMAIEKPPCIYSCFFPAIYLHLRVFFPNKISKYRWFSHSNLHFSRGFSDFLARIHGWIPIQSSIFHGDQEGVTSMVATANRGGARISDEAGERRIRWSFSGWEMAYKIDI